MNKRKHIYKPALWAGFLLQMAWFFSSGCASDKNTIQFSDEHMATLDHRPEDSTASPAKPEKQKLSSQDLFKVEVAVYGYLLQRHFWHDGEYSAVFLQGTDDEVDALLKLFPTMSRQ